jgi:acyl-CoA thioesterase-1
MKCCSRFFRSTPGLILAATAAMIAPAHAEGPASAPQVSTCVAPADLVRLSYPLNRLARRLSAGQPVTIVAVGSSSTAGAGASAPAMNYPSRLAVELKSLYARASITVINRGVNGETAREMLARFDEGVIAEKPDLVIWQVGSNSVLRDQPLAPAGALIREGVARLKAIAKADAEHMVDLIGTTAKETHVDLFQRFALMRYWRLSENLPFDKFVSPDELHMNDWGYGCIAKLLAGAIAEAASRSTQTATATVGR